MPKESIEWEKECCCGKNGICKSLGDTLKLILEVHWEDREKLKELDNVIREHIASAVEAREKEIVSAVKERISNYHMAAIGDIAIVGLEEAISIINPSKE